MNAQKILEQLQPFHTRDARDIMHSGVTLHDHLLATHGILQKWREPEAVCRTGLCHSIYSTEFFHQQSMSYKHRTDVAKIIGREAEELAYLFCVMDRNTLYQNLRDLRNHSTLYNQHLGVDVEITKEQLRALITVAAANLIEQLPRMRNWSIPAIKQLLDSKILLSQAATKDVLRTTEHVALSIHST